MDAAKRIHLLISLTLQIGFQSDSPPSAISPFDTPSNRQDKLFDILYCCVSS